MSTESADQAKHQSMPLDYIWMQLARMTIRTRNEDPISIEWTAGSKLQAAGDVQLVVSACGATDGDGCEINVRWRWWLREQLATPTLQGRP